MKIWQMNRKIDEIKQEKIEYAEILLNNQEYFSILNQKQKQVHTLILQNPETKSPSKIPQKKNLTQLFWSYNLLFMWLFAFPREFCEISSGLRSHIYYSDTR